jgi:hypothetical protein
MRRSIAENRPVPANRANEYLSNLVLEGGRKQHYDRAKTRIPDDAEARPKDSDSRAAPKPEERRDT